MSGPHDYAHYDRRGYPTVPVVEGYAGWSKSYDAFMDERFDVDLLKRSELLAARVSGARIVDLGCGTGRIGQWCRAQGAAEIVGADLSSEMLWHAGKKGVYAHLVEADMCATGLDPASFDGVATSMALCHVASLPDFYAEAKRLLRPGGWVAIVDYHPFFLFAGVPSHFDTEQGESIAIENHVHSFAEHFRVAKAQGFSIRELDERFVDREWVEAWPSYDKHAGWPITFMLALELG